MRRFLMAWGIYNACTQSYLRQIRWMGPEYPEPLVMRRVCEGFLILYLSMWCILCISMECLKITPMLLHIVLFKQLQAPSIPREAECEATMSKPTKPSNDW